TVTRAMRSFLHCEVSAGRCSNLLELHGPLSPPLRIVLQDKAHPVAFVQHANASSLERTRVNECILATLIKLNKSKSLRCVEELHGPVHWGETPLWVARSEGRFADLIPRQELRGSRTSDHQPPRSPLRLLRAGAARVWRSQF